MLLLNLWQKRGLVLNTVPSRKMLEYITALEETNDQLVKSLKLCVEVLTAMHPNVPDQEKWQSMVKEFENIIAISEKVVDKKTIH